MNGARSAFNTKQANTKERFTGRVRIAARFGTGNGPQGTRMTFDAGARTAWHMHPAGSTLLVVEGVGRVQRRVGSIETIGPGDLVWLEPGQRQWHGAAPDQPVTLIALDRPGAAEAVVWMGEVSEDEYRGD